MLTYFVYVRRDGKRLTSEPYHGYVEAQMAYVTVGDRDMSIRVREHDRVEPEQYQFFDSIEWQRGEGM